MIEMDCTRHPKGRSVVPDHPELLGDWIERQPEGARFRMTLKPLKGKRTNQQNRTVMGLWMGIILKELGYGLHEKDNVYYGIKAKCWYTESVNEQTGEVLNIPRATRDMNKGDYSKEFMFAFQHFVFDFFGITLPDPETERAKI